MSGTWSEELKGKFILVVDDDEDLRTVIAEEFRFFKCEVLEANSGRRALELLKTASVDVVVSDIRMADGDGVSLLKALKEKNRLKPAIIFITGFTDLTVVDALHFGADAIFAKPFDVEELMEATARSLRNPTLRWSSIPANMKPKGDFTATFSELETAVKEKKFVVGRGGAFVSSSDFYQRPEDVTHFDITFESGPVRKLKGIARVHWIRQVAEGAEPSGLGLEFLHLDDESRTHMSALVRTFAPAAFIPRG